MALGIHDNVVRRVQPLAAEPIHEDGDRPIDFRPRHAAARLLTADQPPLPVACISVRAIGGRSIRRDDPSCL